MQVAFNETLPCIRPPHSRVFVNGLFLPPFGTLIVFVGAQETGFTPYYIFFIELDDSDDKKQLSATQTKLVIITLPFCFLLSDGVHII